MRAARAASPRSGARSPCRRGKAVTRAQGAAATRLTTTLKLINVTERSEAVSGLAGLRTTQSRAWMMTLTAFFSGLALLGGLFALLRVIRRRARAGADAQLAHLEKAATTDPLTGLRNRRTFEEDLAKALTKGRVCLVMLDLDDLKNTNERLGHAVGDERIRAVSAALRSADAAALGYRLGGDEFAAILAGLGADAGHRFAHRVQDGMRLQHGGDEPSVAVGVAVGEMRTPTDELVRRADTALLAAKRMSSQIRVHSPELDITALPTIGGGRRQDVLAASLAAAVDAKDGDGYDHSGRSRSSRVRSPSCSACRASRSRRYARPACCTTSATSTSTTRSSPRTSRRPTRSGTRSRRTPSAARASSRAAASARSRRGCATTTSASTARATPTASRARRSRSSRGSCTSPTPTRP